MRFRHSAPAIRPALLPGATLAALLTAAAPAARAQGTLGTQGFGYPLGGLSTRVLGTGGGLAEFDPVSAVNPATIALFGRNTFGIQYDPEFRRVEANGTRQNNTIARFPLVAVGVPLRRRVTLGLSASTFLDRTFTTEYQTTTAFAEQNVTATERLESSGSIADVRGGLGVYVSRALRVGIAGHVLTGQDRLVTARTFSDTLRFGSINDTSSVGFAGSMVSAGFELTPVRGISLAGSARYGGSLKATRNDSTVARGDAPNRYGVGLRVDRVSGATFAASFAHTDWTRMQGLTTGTLETHDSDEIMGGVEAIGPRLGDNPLVLRAGARHRTLPFGVGGAEVRETAFSGGLGLPFAGGRTLADLTVQRANRTPSGGTGAVQAAREHAWTLSVGFTVRP